MRAAAGESGKIEKKSRTGALGSDENNDGSDAYMRLEHIMNIRTCEAR
jgi:hypothetical protein